MPTAPSPATTFVPVYGTYRNIFKSGLPTVGALRFTLMERVVSITDKVIFAAGASWTETIHPTTGVVSSGCPAVDDPDNRGLSFIRVTELLEDGTTGLTYDVKPTLAMLQLPTPGLDLSTIIPVNAVGDPLPTLVRGQALGVAGLNAAGNVVNAAGVEVLPGGGGGGGTSLTNYSQVSSLTGYPATFPPAGHTHPATGINDATAVGRAVITAATAEAARTAIGATAAAGTATQLASHAATHTAGGTDPVTVAVEQLARYRRHYTGGLAAADVLQSGPIACAGLVQQRILVTSDQAFSVKVDTSTDGVTFTAGTITYTSVAGVGGQQLVAFAVRLTTAYVRVVVTCGATTTNTITIATLGVDMLSAVDVYA